MKVKVIKEINGLEVGDILNYNEKTHKYELKKVEEDISDKGYSSKKVMHTYSTNAILQAQDYFVLIDEEGDEINIQNTLDQVKKIGNKVEVKETVEISDKELIKQLQETNAKLTKQLEDKNDLSGVNPQIFYLRFPDSWSRFHRLFYGM